MVILEVILRHRWSEKMSLHDIAKRCSPFFDNPASHTPIKVLNGDATEPDPDEVPGQNPVGQVYFTTSLSKRRLLQVDGRDVRLG